MSRLSLAAMAAIAALAACSASARSADSASTNAPPPPMAEAIPLEARRPDTPVAAPIPVAARADAVTCQVRSRRTANGLLIQAHAVADRDISGEYDLLITKSGAAGTSEIAQSGALELAAGSSALLGESEISVERGARVQARLTLRDERGQLCRRSFNF